MKKFHLYRAGVAVMSIVSLAVASGAASKFH